MLQLPCTPSPPLHQGINTDHTPVTKHLKFMFVLGKQNQNPRVGCVAFFSSHLRTCLCMYLSRMTTLILKSVPGTVNAHLL